MSPPTEPEVAPIPYLIFHPLFQDPKFLASVGALFLAVALWLLFGESSTTSTKSAGGKGVPTVVLVGPPRAGKTAIFSALALNQTTSTIPSLTSSTTTFSIPSSNRTYRLVDVPGHPRLKDEVKAKLRTADGVVFVVDAGVAGRQDGVSKIAEEIPPILTSLAAQSLRTSESPRLLITIHKSDSLPLSASQILTRTRQSLTNEMDRLKSSRSTIGGKIESISSVSSGKQVGVVASLLRLFGIGGREKGEVVDEVAEEDAEGLIWGDKGSFKWEDVEGVEIEWSVSSISADKKNAAVETDAEDVVENDGLNEIRSWLGEL